VQRMLRVQSVVAGAAVLMVVTAGCGAVADKAAEKATEEIVGQAGGGDVDINTKDGSVTFKSDDGSFSMDSEDGSFNMESDDGSLSMKSGELPADWPEDLLPLPKDATIISGSTMGSSDMSVLSVTFTTDDAIEKIADRWTDALTAAGYERNMNMDTSDMNNQSWSDDADSTVSIMATTNSDDDQATLVNIVYSA